MLPFAENKFQNRTLLSITTFLILCLNVSYGQTTGTLSVSTTTSEAGGPYKPKNIVAVWIEDPSGNFVKTLLAYAEDRKKHLTAWKASTTAAGSPYNRVDAVTGATRNSHSEQVCSWNGKNFNQTLVADGEYKVKMELTDRNGTGNSAVFSFTKGPNPQTITPVNVPSFSNISIVWTPITTETKEETTEPIILVYPNPVSLQAVILGDGVKSFEVYDLKGILKFSSKGNEINMSAVKPGIYFIKIETDSGKYVKKIIKI